MNGTVPNRILGKRLPGKRVVGGRVAGVGGAGVGYRGGASVRCRVSKGGVRVLVADVWTVDGRGAWRGQGGRVKSTARTSLRSGKSGRSLPADQTASGRRVTRDARSTCPEPNFTDAWAVSDWRPIRRMSGPHRLPLSAGSSRIAFRRSTRTPRSACHPGVTETECR